MPDEELAKKDDDLKLPHHSKNNWQAARTPRRRTMLRYAAYLLVVICFIFLVRRITYSREEDIVRPYSQDRNSDPVAKGVPTQLTAPKATPKAPVVVDTKPVTDTKPKSKSVPDSFEIPAEAASSDDSRHYRGTIKFNALGASLRHLNFGHVGAGAGSVMFAASNLQSAATILPMACQRAATQKERIFFVLFGDSDIKLENLLRVNGFDDSCKILTLGKLAVLRIAN